MRKEFLKSEYPEFPVIVRHQFKPYRHDHVSQMLQNVQRTFGPPGATRRWIFRTPFDGEDDNAWQLDFYFKDSNDSLIFCLKYLGETNDSFKI